MSKFYNQFTKGNVKLYVHLSLAFLPLIVFTVILLILVYRNPFDSTILVSDLSLDTSFTSPTLYVNYPATRLILVASWSSSVALPIIGSLLVFTSFPVAADMIWSSQRGHHGLLPTPSQIAVMTDLLDAKQMAILSWLASFWRKDGRKVPSRWVVEFPAIVQLAALSFSAAIIVADTWLHIATISTTKPYLSPVLPPEAAGSGYFYSRTLTTVCANTSQGVCTVNSANTSAIYALDIDNLASDRSSFHTRINTSESGSYFLAPQLPQLTAFSASNGLNNQTFTAKSFSIGAQCENTTELCLSADPDPNTGAINFTCAGGMSGSVSESQPVKIGSYWQLDGGTYNDMYRYYGNNSVVDVSIVVLLAKTTIQDQGNFSGNTLASTKCSLTFNTVSYEWSNDGTLPTMQSLENSSRFDGPYSIDLARLARGPLFTDFFDSSTLITGEDSSFLSMLDLPPQNRSYTADTVLNRIRATISFFGISLLGGAFEVTAADKLSLADSKVITEVGKAPLFTLVILNLWYASFGILLFGLAMYILRNSETRNDIREVQELISVHGLATAAVKRHRRNLDSSDLRVGVEKVEGIWQFRVFEVSSISGESKPLLHEHDEEAEVAQAWDT